LRFYGLLNGLTFCTEGRTLARGVYELQLKTRDELQKCSQWTRKCLWGCEQTPLGRGAAAVICKYPSILSNFQPFPSFQISSLSMGDNFYLINLEHISVYCNASNRVQGLFLILGVEKGDSIRGGMVNRGGGKKYRPNLNVCFFCCFVIKYLFYCFY